MIRNLFEVQYKNPKPKDWVLTVKKDIEELKLELDIENIKTYTKPTLKRLLNKAVSSKVLKRLNTLKENHSKVSNINHATLKMQNYFKANRYKISREKSQMIF